MDDAALERFVWSRPKSRLAGFLQSQHQALVELAPDRTDEFVELLLREGLGFSPEHQEVRWIDDVPCWRLEIDGEALAIVHAVPSGSSLTPWQLAGSAAYAGSQRIAWICFTNGAEWRVYRYGEGSGPTRTSMFLSAALLDGASFDQQAERLLLISRESMDFRTLEDVWKVRHLLMPDRLLAAVRAESVQRRLVELLPSHPRPDQAAFNAALLSEAGLRAVREALSPGDSLMRLPIFVIRAAMEFNLEQR